MNVVVYDPRMGCAIQGALLVLPLPSGIVIDQSSRVLASTVLTRFCMNGRGYERRKGRFYDDLEIWSGEGRHFLPGAYSLNSDGSLDIETLDPVLEGTGSLFDDRRACGALVTCGVLADAWQCIGMLLVEDCALPLVHEDHPAILIPPGSYYVGRRQQKGFFHAMPNRRL